MFPNHTHVPMRGLPILSISTWKQYTQGMAEGGQEQSPCTPGTCCPKIPRLPSPGDTGLPGASQDEAGLTRKFETSHVGGATGRTPPIPRSALDCIRVNFWTQDPLSTSLQASVLQGLTTTCEITQNLICSGTQGESSHLEGAWAR